MSYLFCNIKTEGEIIMNKNEVIKFIEEKELKTNPEVLSVNLDLNNIQEGIENLKKVQNDFKIILEINLLPIQNQNAFAQFEIELQKQMPDKFPITIKLNEELNKNAICHLFW